jgi:hypothetical protein
MLEIKTVTNGPWRYNLRKIATYPARGLSVSR